MAFVPADRYVVQVRDYYRRKGIAPSKRIPVPPQPFLYVRYKCLAGFTLLDQVDTLFCSNKTWGLTRPVCMPNGLDECRHVDYNFIRYYYYF